MKKTEGGQSISRKVQITSGRFREISATQRFSLGKGGEALVASPPEQVKQWCISKFESVLAQIFNYPLPCTHMQ